MKLKIKHFIFTLGILGVIYFQYYCYHLNLKPNLTCYEVIFYVLDLLILAILTVTAIVYICDWLNKNWNKTVINLSRQNEN